VGEGFPFTTMIGFCDPLSLAEPPTPAAMAPPMIVAPRSVPMTAFFRKDADDASGIADSATLGLDTDFHFLCRARRVSAHWGNTSDTIGRIRSNDIGLSA
jgi:hypothetical protein